MLKNKISKFEKDLCKILAQLAYHIHPDVVAMIQRRNQSEFKLFENIFGDRINVNNYLFDGSACVFPGVKRYVSGKGKKKSFNTEYGAIIDDNTFPRHIWCFLTNGKTYNGPNWKDSGLGEFELAHVFTHKDSELAFEREFFKENGEGLFPYGDFTCACNTVLLPKGTVRPTDNSKAIKSVFYKRYIDLYGEIPLKGRQGFREDSLPIWYNEVVWNDPYRPSGWASNTEKLLEYRTRRIRQIMN